MHSFLRARVQRYVLVFVAVFGLAAMPPAMAQEFDYTGTLDVCGGLCLALGGLFGITTGSDLNGIYDSVSGDFCGQVGTGGSSGFLAWDTALLTGTSTCALNAEPDTWALNAANAGLMSTPTAVTGGFLAIDNFGDAGALASLIVFVSGSGPQDFGVPGGVVADWVAYLPDAMLNPDPASVVARGSGTWSLRVTPVPQISVPASVDFMDVVVNGIASMNVTVSNTGTADLTLTAAPVLTGADAAFSIAAASTCTNGLVIAPMASCMTTIDYSPTVAGPTTQSLTIASNDPGGVVTVPVTATAVEADILVNPQTLPFMQVQLGESLTLDVTITNTGGATLLIPGIDTAGNLNGTDFSIPVETAPIAAGFLPPGLAQSRSATHRPP